MVSWPRSSNDRQLIALRKAKAHYRDGCQECGDRWVDEALHEGCEPSRIVAVLGGTRSDTAGLTRRDALKGAVAMLGGAVLTASGLPSRAALAAENPLVPADADPVGLWLGEYGGKPPLNAQFRPLNSTGLGSPSPQDSGAVVTGDGRLVQISQQWSAGVPTTQFRSIGANTADVVEHNVAAAAALTAEGASDASSSTNWVRNATGLLATNVVIRRWGTPASIDAAGSKVPPSSDYRVTSQTVLELLSLAGDTVLDTWYGPELPAQTVGYSMVRAAIAGTDATLFIESNISVATTVRSVAFDTSGSRLRATADSTQELPGQIGNLAAAGTQVISTGKSFISVLGDTITWFTDDGSPGQQLVFPPGVGPTRRGSPQQAVLVGGTLVLTNGYDGIVRFINIESGELESVVQLGSPAVPGDSTTYDWPALRNVVATSPDDSFLAVLDNRKAVGGMWLLSAADGHVVRQILPSQPLNDVQFDATGRFLAATSALLGTLYLVDVVADSARAFSVTSQAFLAPREAR